MSRADLSDLAAGELTVDEQALATVFDAWRLEYADRFAQPRASGDCWLDERFEYQFSLGAATGSGERASGPAGAESKLRPIASSPGTAP